MDIKYIVKIKYTIRLNFFKTIYILVLDTFVAKREKKDMNKIPLLIWWLLPALLVPVTNWGQAICVPAEAAKLQSAITVPIQIPLSEVEKMVNSTLQGLIYEDNSYTDNDNDNFKVKVWKQGNLSLTPNAANQFQISVPLKVWAEKGYGAFGYNTYKDCTFEMEIRFKTSFNIAPDWSVKTVTTPAGYKWITRPVLDFAGVKIPITPIVEKILDQNYAEFSRTIDDQIKQNLNFNTYALQAWNLVQQPYLVSEEYKSWMLITPIGVRMTPIRIRNSAFVSTLGFDIISQTVTGCVPVAPSSVRSLPKLQIVPQIDPKFEVNTAALIDYGYATNLAGQYFENYKMEFLNGKYTLYLYDISVGEEDGKLLINSKVRGDTKGDIILKGTPYYDIEKNEIGIMDTKFDLKTKNLFQRSASWLFNGLIEKNIEKAFKIPVGPIIDATKAGLISALNTEYYKGVKVKGGITELKPTAIKPVVDGIQVIIYTKGEINLDVKGL